MRSITFLQPHRLTFGIGCLVEACDYMPGHCLIVRSPELHNLNNSLLTVVIDRDLTRLGLDRGSIPRMAAAAITVQRLLRNYPRELTQADPESIYGECFLT